MYNFIYLFWAHPKAVWVIILFHLNCAHCFVITPKNVVRRIGENAVMNCASNDINTPCGNLVWTKLSPKASEENYISKFNLILNLDFNHTTLYSSNGNCNLNITVQASTEGRYTCIHSITAIEVTAQLIVLEDGPRCFIENDVLDFNITCSVRFLGNWPPMMRWTQLIGTDSLAINATEYIITDRIVRSTVFLRNSTSYNTAVWCSVGFSESQRPHGAATNIPEYEWTSPVFKIKREYEVMMSTESANLPRVVYISTFASTVSILSFALMAVLAVAAFKWWKIKSSHQTQRSGGQLMPAI